MSGILDAGPAAVKRRDGDAACARGVGAPHGASRAEQLAAVDGDRLAGDPARKRRAQEQPLGQSDEESTTRIVESMKGVMRHLGMRADGPPPVAHPVWIGRNEVVRAGATGLVQPLVERGTTVAQGAVLARIVDVFGDLVEQVRAPFDGEVLYILGTPPVSKGEPVAFIGARTAEPARP